MLTRWRLGEKGAVAWRNERHQARPFAVETPYCARAGKQTAGERKIIASRAVEDRYRIGRQEIRHVANKDLCLVRAGFAVNGFVILILGADSAAAHLGVAAVVRPPAFTSKSNAGPLVGQRV